MRGSCRWRSMHIAGIGGMIAAQLVAHAGFGFLPALVTGTVGAMLVGLAFAIPALRTRGVNLAVITLAAAWAAQDMLFNNPHTSGGSRDQGGSGDDLRDGHQRDRPACAIRDLHACRVRALLHPGREHPPRPARTADDRGAVQRTRRGSIGCGRIQDQARRVRDLRRARGTRRRPDQLPIPNRELRRASTHSRRCSPSPGS